ncbi:MAG: 4Fe-4S dicluster domain-containing protein [Gammaproteobacteria bacterium]|nr:4Fe-4S dicluster domain-containing protein [Gammaproteobacteria bacterium]MBU1655959.1 4Fe-4S dicluster domain-containing protein [Gammaproteobacteria bacterium]MBU1962471.1 4Fe-4S dicluster domain-containing protein [Gammaproteobacteria bacterium]
MAFGKIKNVTGIVTINKNWCKGCGFCVGFCPTNALAMSDEYNAKGYHPPYVKTPEDCRNCDFCQSICPEFAIYVNRKAEPEENEHA